MQALHLKFPLTRHQSLATRYGGEATIQSP